MCPFHILYLMCHRFILLKECLVLVLSSIPHFLRLVALHHDIVQLLLQTFNSSFKLDVSSHHIDLIILVRLYPKIRFLQLAVVLIYLFQFFLSRIQLQLSSLKVFVFKPDALISHCFSIYEFFLSPQQGRKFTFMLLDVFVKSLTLVFKAVDHVLQL